MNPDPGLLPSILLLVFLIGTNAFFAMSEIAVLSVQENRIKRLADNGNKKAKTLLKVTKEPSDFLATIQVGVTLSGFLASAVAAENFAGILVEALAFLPVNRELLNGISIVVITILLSYVTLIFGELVPKRVGMNHAEKISLSVSGILWAFYRVAKPFVRLLAASTNGMLRLLHISEEEQKVTEEDILSLVDAGEEGGILEENEKNMIENIFEFDDKDVGKVMVHRTEIAAVDIHSTTMAVLDLAAKEGYSRIPVYEGNLDHIVGIIYVKDLISAVGTENKNLSLRQFMRAPLYVPKSKSCSSLLKEFQERKVHIAVAIDERGGTAGLVTLEDLLEIIVGNIQDEFDHEPEEFQQIGDRAYLIDGSAFLWDIEKRMGIHLFDHCEADTIGGYILEKLERFPVKNEKFLLQNSGFQVIIREVSERRIKKVLIKPLDSTGTE